MGIKVGVSEIATTAQRSLRIRVGMFGSENVGLQIEGSSPTVITQVEKAQQVLETDISR